MSRGPSQPLATGRSSPFLALPLAAALLLTCDGGGCAESSPPPFWSNAGLVAADLDGDGRVDVAVASSYVAGPPPHRGYVLLYRQSGPGTFDAPVQYEIGLDPRGISTGDLDGDGRLDLVVATPSTVAPDPGAIDDSGGVSVLRQDPAHPGRFLPSQWIRTGGAPTDAAIALLDGDALADIVVADGVTINGRALLLAQLAGSTGFASPVSLLLGSGQGSEDLAVGDVDGDGRDDIVLAASAVAVLYQRAGGGFEPVVLLPAGLHPQGVALGDVDGDGRLDIAVANAGNAPAGGTGGSSVTLLRQTSPGTFLATELAVPDGARRAVIADLNADGVPDLAVVSLVYQSQSPSQVTVLLQSAASRGSFAPGRTYDGPFSASFIAAADLDGDGRIDLVLNQGPSVLTQSPTTPGTFLPVRPLR